MRRTTCGSCGSTGLDIFLKLGDSPVADAYTETGDEPVARYPLDLAVCDKCRLVQLMDVLSDEILFGTGYSFYSSASPPLSAYHAEYANDVIQLYDDEAQHGVVEIGCNDGDMLRHFKYRGYETLGVDPAGGPVEVARDRGLSVINVPFTYNMARGLGEGATGVVIANHVLAHVPDVHDFLKGIAYILRPTGIVKIEVQYVQDLLVNNAFDLVYHEHRNFFSLAALEIAASRVGLTVIDAELTDRQGGSLRATLAKRVPDMWQLKIQHIRDSEIWLQDQSTYSGFQGRVNRIRERLTDMIWDLTQDRMIIAGYGAPAKATTLLNFCNLTSNQIECVYDTTPAKQGRFIPGTGIPIIKPPHDGDEMSHDVYLALSWNYLGTLLRKNLTFIQNGGMWIVPIPAPMML
jgi:SAM-dependent methyltransferase